MATHAAFSRRAASARTAASFGVLGWVLVDYIRTKGRFSVVGACSGAIAGLVGITPAAGYVSVWIAALIGFLSRFWARRLGMSALAVTVASIVPLLPGLSVYTGISQIIAEPGAAGLTAGLPSLAGAAGPSGFAPIRRAGLYGVLR